MTKLSQPPKRDFLPSQRADHVTRALDEAYERGYVLGKADGLEHAANVLRAANIPNIGDIIQTLTRAKYQ